MGFRTCIISAASTVFLLSGYAAQAQTSADAARAIVTPFYNALNAGPGKDPGALIRSVTTPGWVSCGSDDSCGPREAVIAGITGLGQAVPNLSWTIKDIMVAGNHVVVRGEASGTPAGEFMGVPGTGKSFKVMSIDIHTIEDGKISRSYHVEDWISAVKQLTAK
jgi:ketosteroid isomerase-like protein